MKHKPAIASSVEFRVKSHQVKGYWREGWIAVRPKALKR